MENVERKNTVKCQFEVGNVKPTDVEMLKFVMRHGLTEDEIYSCNMDTMERCIYVKFNQCEQMEEYLRRVNGSATFVYENGLIVKLKVTEATAVKYVRVFNLPMEIEDREIAAAFSEFGEVVNVVKEKYIIPGITLQVYSTVRGVYIHMQKETPSQLRIRNCRARCYYFGQRERCFLCNSTEHRKSECRSMRPADAVRNTISYSDMLSGNETNIHILQSSDIVETTAEAPIRAESNTEIDSHTSKEQTAVANTNTMTLDEEMIWAEQRDPIATRSKSSTANASKVEVKRPRKNSR